MTIYNQEAQKNLKEQLAYEVALLEQVYGLFHRQTAMGTPDDAVVHYRGAEPKVFRYASFSVDMWDWRPGFLRHGSPLIFNVVVKLADCLVEWILKKNTPPLKKTNQYREKLEQLKRTDVAVKMPPLFQELSWLHDVFFALYKNLYEYRNTVTHRWQFSVDEQGGLQIAHRDATEKMLELSPEKLLSLADFMVRVVRLLTAEWTLDKLHERHIRHLADKLSDLHGLRKFDQKPAVLMDISYVVPWEGEADVVTLENWLKKNSTEHYDTIISMLFIASAGPDGERECYSLTDTQFFELPAIFTMSDVAKIANHCEFPARVEDSLSKLETSN